MELHEQGAVGDVCARYYDSQGQVLDVELNHRVIGIKLHVLHEIECVIGVAGGLAKAEAILGALRGDYIKILVADDVAARKVLELGQ